MRLFIAVTPPPSVRRQLVKLFKQLARKHWPVKWEAIEKLHFTLVFLGEVEPQRLVTLQSVVEDTARKIKPFSVAIKGLGCFPDYLLPRLIWLGLKGDLTTLAHLRKLLDQKLLDKGFIFGQKPFVPHLTLGRIKQARFRQKREIGRQLRALRTLEFKSEWQVKTVDIFESQTLASGSIYREVARCPLKT